MKWTFDTLFLRIHITELLVFGYHIRTLQLLSVLLLLLEWIMLKWFEIEILRIYSSKK